MATRAKTATKATATQSRIATKTTTTSKTATKSTKTKSRTQSQIKIQNKAIKLETDDDYEENADIKPLQISNILFHSLKSHFTKGIKDENILCCVLKDTLSGISYMHNQGRIHRDIWSLGTTALELEFATTYYTKIAYESYHLSNIILALSLKLFKCDCWIPFIQDDVQFEFIRLDAFTRQFLIHDGKGNYKIDFMLPVRCIWMGYLFTETLASVIPFRHEEYYIGCASIIVGFAIFTLVFLFGNIKDRKSRRKIW